MLSPLRHPCSLPYKTQIKNNPQKQRATKAKKRMMETRLKCEFGGTLKKQTRGVRDEYVERLEQYKRVSTIKALSNKISIVLAF